MTPDPETEAIKANRIVASCETLEHYQVARKYMSLLVTRMLDNLDNYTSDQRRRILRAHSELLERELLLLPNA